MPLAPTVLAASRGKLVQAVFPFSWMGLCTTTVVQVVWGSAKDPAIAIPLGVVLDFLVYLSRSPEMKEQVQEDERTEEHEAKAVVEAWLRAIAKAMEAAPRAWCLLEHLDPSPGTSS